MVIFRTTLSPHSDKWHTSYLYLKLYQVFFFTSRNIQSLTAPKVSVGRGWNWVRLTDEALSFSPLISQKQRWDSLCELHRKSHQHSTSLPMLSVWLLKLSFKTLFTFCFQLKDLQIVLSSIKKIPKTQVTAISLNLIQSGNFYLSPFYSASPQSLTLLSLQCKSYERNFQIKGIHHLIAIVYSSNWSLDVKKPQQQHMNLP